MLVWEANAAQKDRLKGIHTPDNSNNNNNDNNNGLVNGIANKISALSSDDDDCEINIDDYFNDNSNFSENNKSSNKLSNDLSSSIPKFTTRFMAYSLINPIITAISISDYNSHTIFPDVGYSTGQFLLIFFYLCVIIFQHCFFI
jgi:hypothetical protein